MYREFEERLLLWKRNLNKKPLIIKGARQVGKTYTIRKFAHEQYKHVVELNFERDVHFIDVFEKTRNPKDLLEYFKITYMDVTFNQDTLLFLDEIQACPSAITALKFMNEEFPCDVICSGSMLGVAIAKSTSFPVGYVETWDMYPMGFLEFSIACGVSKESLEKMTQATQDLKGISEILHEKFNELFTTYMVVGGMPEVVKQYIETKSYKNCIQIQRRIVNDYMNDMIKYALPADKIKARECFSSIPIQLAKDNKKFQYSVVKKGYNARHFDSSLQWLEDSGLIIKTNRLSTIAMPLKAQIELAVFKVYMCDIGLLLSQLDDGDIQRVILGDLGVYKGALYENVVAQIMMKSGKSSYYYEPSQNVEIDFIIQYEGGLTPIEVKSSKNTISKSFHNYIDKYRPNKAFRFSQKQIGNSSDGHVCYLPLYLLESVLQNEKGIL